MKALICALLTFCSMVSLASYADHSGSHDGRAAVGRGATCDEAMIEGENECRRLGFLKALFQPMAFGSDEQGCTTTWDKPDIKLALYWCS